MQETASNQERRALIVEGDPEMRRVIGDTLTRRGFLVSACDSLAKGREFYRRHALVVTGCMNENGDVQRFVDFVRQSSGANQPYIIALKDAEETALTMPGPGVNDLLGVPVDSEMLELKVNAATAWLTSREAIVRKPVEETPAAEPAIEEAEEALPEEPAQEVPDEADFEIDYESGADGPPDFEEFLIAPVEEVEDEETPVAEAAAEADEEADEEADAEPAVDAIPDDAPAASAQSQQSAAAEVAPASVLRYHMGQLIETVPFGVALFDTSMHYRVANDRWKRSFGLEGDSVIGRSHYDIFSEIPSPWRKCCQRAMETDEEQTDLELVEWADGSRERIRWTMRPWHYESGETGGVVVSFENAEDPNAAAEVLNPLDTDLAAALAQSTTAPVLVLDTHGRIVRSNALARELGIWNEVHDKERFYWQVYLAREQRPPVQDAFISFASRIIEHGEFAFPATTLDTIPCADGIDRRIAWHNLPRHGADGRVNGMIRIGVDVNELSEQGVEASAITDEHWLDQLPTLHWKARRDGKLVFFNKAWLDFRGRTAIEEADNGWMDGLHEDDHSRLIDAFLELDESGGRLNQVARLQGAFGDFRWMRFVIPPGKYSNEPDGGVFVGFCEDITSQKNFEEQLALLEQTNAELRDELEGLREAAGGKEAQALSLQQQIGSVQQELTTREQEFSALQKEYDTMLGESAKVAESLNLHEENETRLQKEIAALGNDLRTAREANEKLKIERGRFAAIPENAPFGIVVLTRDGQTIYANPAHKQVVGSDILAEGVFEDWLRSRCPEDSDEARAELVERWREHVWRGHHTHVFSLKSEDDSLRELEIRPKMMRDGQFLLSIFDITDSRRGEAALRTSEAKFRTLFYDSGVAMALVDRGGAIIDANSAAVKLFGRSKNDIARHRVEEFIAREDRKKREELLARLQTTQQRTADAALSVLAADGSSVPVQMNVSVVRDKDGGALFTAYFFHRRETQDAAPEPDRGPELEASPDLILLTSLAGVIERLIPSAKFSRQIDATKAVGMKVSDLFPGLKASVTELGARATQIRGTVVQPFQIREKDVDHDYECRVSCSGENHLALIIREAPPAQAAAPAVVEAAAPAPVDPEKKRQALAFANIRDAIVIADLKGHIIDWNPGAERLFGYPKDAIVDKGLYLLYDKDDPKRFKARITRGITTERRWKERTEFIRSDGSTGVCEVDYVPMLDENGTPMALIGTNREVTAEATPPATAEKSSALPEPKLTPAVDSAWKAATSSASARNLSAIAEMLELQESATRERSAHRAISAGCGRVRALTMLQRQAEESGDFARVDFGRYIRSLVQDLLERVAPDETAIEVHLNAKNVVLPYDTAAPLASALCELLTNALSHGFPEREDGVVTIGARVQSDGKGRLFVRDNGVGLPEWLDVAESPGLGLQIARKFARQMGGDLAVVPGKDTEMQITFSTAP